MILSREEFKKKCNSGATGDIWAHDAELREQLDEARKWANCGGNPFILDGVHQQCKSDPRDIHLIYGTAHGDRETGFACELHSFKEMLTATGNSGGRVTDYIDQVIRDVAELPDRDSPEGWQEAMLVTGPELRAIIEGRITERPSDAVMDAARKVAEEWERRDRIDLITSDMVHALDALTAVLASDPKGEK